MSGLAIIGLLLAVLVDLLIPLALLIRWLPRNARFGARPAPARAFWIFTGIYLVWIVFLCVVALRDAYTYNGYATYVAVAFALPMSTFPAIFNSNVIHFFFSTEQWATFGYVMVMPVFLAGVALWALVLPVGLRRFFQWGSDRQSVE